MRKHKWAKSGLGAYERSQRVTRWRSLSAQERGPWEEEGASPELTSEDWWSSSSCLFLQEPRGRLAGDSDRAKYLPDRCVLKLHLNKWEEKQPTNLGVSAIRSPLFVPPHLHSNVLVSLVPLTTFGRSIQTVYVDVCVHRIMLEIKLSLYRNDRITFWGTTFSAVAEFHFIPVYQSIHYSRT